ncbi:hypothetical protein LP421_02155 (plasmid) [Rhizobium sp. RCAM05350]|nr:hypothetical protein LP421_02155 [Rhizobium sp. RCAM05350]
MNYTFDFAPVFAAWPMLLEGVIGTLRMSSLSMVFGLSLGIVFMMMRMSTGTGNANHCRLLY